MLFLWCANIIANDYPEKKCSKKWKGCNSVHKAVADGQASQAKAWPIFQMHIALAIWHYICICIVM